MSAAFAARNRVAIAGFAQSKVQRRSPQPLGALAADTARRAIDDAGLRFLVKNQKTRTAQLFVGGRTGDPLPAFAATDTSSWPRRARTLEGPAISFPIDWTKVPPASTLLEDAFRSRGATVELLTTNTDAEKALVELRALDPAGFVDRAVARRVL